MARRTRRRIGFVTMEELRALTPDDRSAFSAFSAAGIEVVPTVWTEPLPEGLDALVLRSTWDYHLRLADFLAWVSAVEARGIPLWNSPDTVRWNVDKAYLLEVEARGVPILPTRHAARGSGVALSALLREAGWEQAVVKPSISGGAFETWRTGAGAEDAARFASQLEAMDCLVQPFAPELVLYQAGADPYREDQLGGLALTFAGLETRDRAVIDGCARRGIAVATTLGGGYARRFEDTVRIHATTSRLALAVARRRVGEA